MKLRMLPLALLVLAFSCGARNGTPDVYAQVAYLRVQVAAHNEDYEALRDLMSDDFMWNNDSDPSTFFKGADKAIAEWKGDPAILPPFDEMIEAGCGVTDDPDVFYCGSLEGEAEDCDPEPGTSCHVMTAIGQITFDKSDDGRYKLDSYEMAGD